MDPQAFQETTKRLHDLKAKADNLKVARRFMLLLLCTCIGNLQVHANGNMRATKTLNLNAEHSTLNPKHFGATPGIPCRHGPAVMYAL